MYDVFQLKCATLKQNKKLRCIGRLSHFIYFYFRLLIILYTGNCRHLHTVLAAFLRAEDKIIDILATRAHMNLFSYYTWLQHLFSYYN